MPIPTGISVVDLMIGFPKADARANYDFARVFGIDVPTGLAVVPSQPAEEVAR